MMTKISFQQLLAIINIVAIARYITITVGARAPTAKRLGSL